MLVMFRLWIAGLLVACSSSPMMSGDDVVPIPDAPHPSLDPADCTRLAQSFTTAAMTCGTPLPAGAQAAFEGWCKKGINAAAMCAGNPAAGLDCFSSPDSTDWVCAGGEPYPACNGDIAAALGAYCLIALGNPACASGVQCTYDADCSSGFACNSATGQCMSRSAYCVGLPCQYDVDCPTRHRCNGTEHMCIGS